MTPREDHRLRALTILYHDVVAEHFDESGFPGEAAARYKLRRADFERHLAAMTTRGIGPAVAASRASLPQSPMPFFLTVDDGGSSAIFIAETLERLGWRGTFFITTDRIGTAAFVSAQQIRWLHRRGHAIGSHSCSHPYRMADLDDVQLLDEWRRSLEVLSDIVQSPVQTASVPGGFYAPRVARAAAAAGVRVLFNSEPTTAIQRVDDCLIVGRINVYGSMSADTAARLASGDRLALLKQQALWTAKKTIKTVAAPAWDLARTLLFRS